MVQIIEERQDAGRDDCIEFTVYRSPINPDRILARWQHAKDEGHAVAIASEILGTPVDIEFRRAAAYASEYGVPHVWVNDPAGLFPPSRRPTI
jgi:hypothetical protein